MTFLLPPAEIQLCDENGLPYAGGKIYTYIPNSSTLKTTWSVQDKSASNTNPIILNSAGRATIWGEGNYRMVLFDASNNQIWDAITAAALPDDAISAVMLPVVGAATLATARDLMGITAAIAAAIAGIGEIVGPAGPAGAPGAQGAQGEQGIPGAAATGLATSNPGYWIDTSSGFIVNFGSATTDSGGNANVTFARAYPHGVLVPPIGTCTTGGATGWWFTLASYSAVGFTGATGSPFVGGSWKGGPMPFSWISAGY